MPSREESMPNIVLKWTEEHYESEVEPYSRDANWILDLIWRRTGTGVALPMQRGLYVIEDTTRNANGPIYAGQADNFSNRFKQRSDVLRNFRLLEDGINPVATRNVRLAQLEGDADLNFAENWLVRILYLADAAQILQNKDLIEPITVPSEGLDVQNVDPPSYLQEEYSYPGHVTI
jgi:hypothetical protein